MPKVFSSYEATVGDPGCGCGGASTSATYKGFRVTDGANIQSVAQPASVVYNNAADPILVVSNRAISVQALLSETSYGSIEEFAAQACISVGTYARQVTGSLSGSQTNPTETVTMPSGIYLPDPGGFFSEEHLHRIMTVKVNGMITIRGLHYEIVSTTQLRFIAPPFVGEYEILINSI